MKINQLFRQIAIALLAATPLAFQPATAQPPGAFEVPSAQAPLGAADLETLVGPIALYADDLVGVVLPASTYPLQIVQAGRFLDDLESDSSLQPDPDWDDSVVALLNYPEVLRMMDANIEWTWALGEAVLDQQPEVLDAIQVFRGRALEAGNLASNEQQVVTQDDGLIEIAPAEPEVIYIPYYEPERVVVVQPRPVIHYYSHPYPIYYYPYPIGYSFATPFFWGVTSAFHIGWHSHLVHLYHHGHYAHPYYGRSYYSPYYARRSVNVTVNYTNYAWEPRHRYAGRPRRTESGLRTVASREGRAPNLRDANYSQVRTRTESRTSAQRAPVTSREAGRIAGQRSPVSRQANGTSPQSAARTQAAPTRSSVPTRSTATQRSYAGRPAATASSPNPQTFSASRAAQTSRTAPTSRPLQSGRSAQPAPSVVTQPRARAAQPAVSSGGLGQRKSFGYERSSSSGNAAASSRSSGAVRGATRSAPQAAPRAAAPRRGSSDGGGRTRSR